MEGTDTQRLFFALWPDDGLRRQLQQVGTEVASPGGGRPMAPENLHITLAFLGRIGADARRCMEDAANIIQLPAFTLSLDQAGYWPRPRVIWLGSRETPAPLQQLAQRLTDAMAACGLKPEPRPYTPHLTLMRKAVRGPARCDIPPLTWAADSFVLVESLTWPEGVQYRVVRRWSLQPFAGGQD